MTNMWELLSVGEETVTVLVDIHQESKLELKSLFIPLPRVSVMTAE
jgi:hypothetical protein